jgi:hypothetical protein
MRNPAVSFYDYQVYPASAMEEFRRLFGAPRQKPGFPLQVLGFAHANPAGFPLQSLARVPAAGDDYTIPQRKIYREVENWQGRGRKKREKRAIVAKFLSSKAGKNSGLVQVLSKLNENFLDFFDFAVKKFCGSSLGAAWGYRIC